MRRQLLWIASLLAIGMSACTTFRPPPLDTAKACAEWRWIGISRPEAGCPDIPGWTVHPLFPQLAPIRLKSGDYCEEKAPKKKDSEKVPSPELIRELNRFCVYEVAHKWLGHHPSPPASAELVRLDQDCAALSTGARVEEETAWEPDSRRLLAQVGIPGETLTIANPFGVRLAFLDTEATREEIPTEQGRSPHGYTLAHIARHLVCRGGSCAARITTQLALPIIDFDAKSRKLTRIDDHGGGYLGTQSDLAKAIWREVSAWQQTRRQKSPEQHLVLNLSLAWDGELFGGLDEEQVDEMKAGTQAVYRALQYAADFDVLVLAAAGNRQGEPCPNFGPLLPAAWERGGQREESCGGPRKDSPLLYAVGGVDSKGDPLINARPGGMPRRAAYADDAVVACPDSKQHTAMLTGSSVATAVVSSIASVVWASYPTLTSSEVMAIVDASGQELDLLADFWFPGSIPTSAGRPKVHKLSLCSALERACKEQGPCVPEPGCNPGTSEPSPPSSSKKRPWRPNSCQPWLFPQPEVDPCPVCPPYKP